MRNVLANLRTDAEMIGSTACQLFGLALFSGGVCAFLAIFF